MDYKVTTRGDPDAAIELLVNGKRLKLPNTTEEEFEMPEGEPHFGDDVLEVPPLSILFSVLDGVC